MNHQNELLASVIEHLGIPLLSAVSNLSKDQKVASPEKQAQIAARLLTASVKMGMGLSGKMSMVSDTEKAEALRFRLTALSAHVISDQIVNLNKEVSEEELDKVTASIDSILSFSSHFSLSSDGIGYLQGMDMSVLGAEEAVKIRTLEAMLPLMIAISEKPIVPDVNKTIEEMAQRLMAETDVFSKKMYGNDHKLKHLLDQKIFSLLVATLKQAYMKELQAGKPQIENVWLEFDKTKAIALVLCDYLVTGQNHIDTEDVASGAASSAPKSEVNVADMPEHVEIQPYEPAAIQEQQLQQEVMPQELTERQEVKKPSGDPNNPMSFFKKPT